MRAVERSPVTLQSVAFLPASSRCVPCGRQFAPLSTRCRGIPANWREALTTRLWGRIDLHARTDLDPSQTEEVVRCFVLQ